jgi:hypothetical protein
MPPRIKVPVVSPQPLMIDGKFASAEWHDASVTAVTPGVTLYVQQFQGHVFIGVKGDDAAPFYVDLFLLGQDNCVYDLHASMQVGERLLCGDAWTDTDPPIQWGNNIDWIANEAKADPRKDRTCRRSTDCFPERELSFSCVVADSPARTGE